jgi:hypothetical protein
MKHLCLDKKEVVNLNTDVSLSVAMWNTVVYSNKSHCGSIQGSFAKNIQALIPFPNYYSM